MIAIGVDVHKRRCTVAMQGEDGAMGCFGPMENTREGWRELLQSLPPDSEIALEVSTSGYFAMSVLEEAGWRDRAHWVHTAGIDSLRKQKYDRLDAEHILNLLGWGDFPKLWLPSAVEHDVRVLLEHRTGGDAHAGEEWLASDGAQLWRAATLQAVECTRPSRASKDSSQGRDGAASERLAGPDRTAQPLVKELDQRIEQEVEQREDAQRLMTHPGVGPLTALGTVLVLGPVERFPNAKHVTSYRGRIPEEDSSGGRQRFGKLTKQGNRLLRFLLVEAAQIVARYDAGLGRVYRRLAFRKGAPSAKVAVARKLAIRLYIMLRDKIDYAEFCRRGSHAGMLASEPLV